MIVYAYGTPSYTFIKAMLKARNALPRWMRYPLVCFTVIVWAALVPPAWVMVKIGDIGHLIGGWVGFDSREW